MKNLYKFNNNIHKSIRKIINSFIIDSKNDLY
jgi:hypothetical protein